MEFVKELLEALHLQGLWNFEFLSWFESDGARLAALVVVCVGVLLIVLVAICGKPLIENLRLNAEDRRHFSLEQQRHKDKIKVQRAKLRSKPEDQPRKQIR